MCSFDELVLRETGRCIQKWSKCRVKFEKLNTSSKEFILIQNDDLDDFIKALGIGKALRSIFLKIEIWIDLVTKKVCENVK